MIGKIVESTTIYATFLVRINTLLTSGVETEFELQNEDTMLPSKPIQHQSLLKTIPSIFMGRAPELIVPSNNSINIGLNPEICWQETGYYQESKR